MCDADSVTRSVSPSQAAQSRLPPKAGTRQRTRRRTRAGRWPVTDGPSRQPVSVESGGTLCGPTSAIFSQASIVGALIRRPRAPFKCTVPIIGTLPNPPTVLRACDSRSRVRCALARKGGSTESGGGPQCGDDPARSRARSPILRLLRARTGPTRIHRLCRARLHRLRKGSCTDEAQVRTTTRSRACARGARTASPPPALGQAPA